MFPRVGTEERFYQSLHGVATRARTGAREPAKERKLPGAHNTPPNSRIVVCGQAGGFLDNADRRPYNGEFAAGAGRPLWALTMDKKRLEYYKKKLLARREELLKIIARTEEEGRSADDDPTVDLADKAANSYTKEFLFEQTNHERSTLRLVEEALKRMKEGSYGLCVNCQEEVQQKRLEAVPWARHCIACQEKQERGQL
jgi:DnaK suppressor protein